MKREYSNVIGKFICACGGLFLLGWLALFSCTPPTTTPDKNLCIPEAGGFQEHLDWRAFQTKVNHTPEGWSGCLQMSWTEGSTYRNASTVRIRIDAEGDLKSAQVGKQSPFTGLEFPKDPGRYAYRFRIFFHTFDKNANNNETCTQAMRDPVYDCLSSAQSDACWFFHELRFPQSAFTGKAVAIEGDEALLCKTYLRATPLVQAEPTTEASAESPPDAAGEAPAPDMAQPEQTCPQEVSGSCEAPPESGPRDGPLAHCQGVSPGQSDCPWIQGAYQVNLSDAIHDLVAAPNGDVYIVGSFTSTEFMLGALPEVKHTGKESMFLAKLNNKGEWQWLETYSGTDNDARIAGYGIALDAAQHIYVTGYFVRNILLGDKALTTTDGTPRMFVAKRNADGTWAWVNQGRGPQGCWGGKIQVDESGRAYVAGIVTTPAIFYPFGGTKADGTHAFLLRTNPDGSWEWIQTFRQVSRMAAFQKEHLPSISVRASGVYFTSYFQGSTEIGGRTFATGGGSKTSYIIKLFLKGFVQWVHVIGSSNDMLIRKVLRGTDKVIAITGRIAANQTTNFAEGVALKVGPKDVGFLAFIDVDGLWLSAIALAGQTDAIKATALGTNDEGIWYIGGDVKGTLALGTHTITTEGSGAHFLATYDQPKAQWTGLIAGDSLGPTNGSAGLQNDLHLYKFGETSLYLSGGHLFKSFGPYTFKKHHSMFVAKDIHLTP